MKKQALYLIVFFLSFYGGIDVFAQVLTDEERDSISLMEAYSKYYQAVDFSNALPTKERIQLMLQVDSVYLAQELWPHRISGLTVLCNLYQWNREYDKLDELSEEALKIARNHLEKNDANYSMALNLRGVALYEGIRDIDKATELLKESIELGKNNGTSLLQVSRTYFNLGSFYLDAGDYDQAIDHSLKALQIEIDSSNYNDPMIPTLSNQLGLCYSNKNKSDEAIGHYQEGLKIAKAVYPSRREVDQIILYLYQNLSELYIKNGPAAAANEYIKLALDFQQGQSFLKDAYTYQLQGNVLMSEKKYELALRAYQASTESATVEFQDFEHHPDIGITYFLQGNARLAQQEIDAALADYQLALIHNAAQFSATDPKENPTLEDLVNPLQAVDVFEGKAQAFLKKYEQSQELAVLESAYNNYQLAIAAIEKIRQSFNAQGSKYNLSEKAVQIYEGAINTVFDLYQKTKEKKWLTLGLAFAEGNKAATLLESMQGSEALMASNIPDSLLTKEQELKLEIAFYERLIHEARQRKESVDPVLLKNQQAKLLDLREDYQQLIDYFEINDEEYFALKFKKEELDINAVQQELKKAVLIEFFVGEENIFVFTISQENIFCEKIEKQDQFTADIRSLRQLISTPPESESLALSLTAFRSTAHQIYTTLLSASLAKIPTALELEQLILIPDDILAFVPFAVLLDQPSTGTSFKVQPYLGNRFAISYNYSISIWRKLMKSSNRSANKLFMGMAPDFSTYPTEEKLSPLACNTEEVNRIGKLMPDSDLKLKETANLESFSSQASDYHIIHLATHATLDNGNSAFNKIYFADQYISQNDLYQLKLNASLAVLSACNTGAGELLKGEGVMSLSRGFMHAGCPSVLMSLWSVDDCTTSELMFQYYELLLAGKSKAIALQLAKLNYLAQTNDILQSHPYYWAPFVQYGSTAPLNFRGSSWPAYLFEGAAGVLVLLGIFWWRKG